MKDRTKLKAGILGATGLVGQRFIQLLESSPHFEICALGASSKSAGKPYQMACPHWKLDTEIPLEISKMIVQECSPEHFTQCALVFSGLVSAVAGKIENEFVMAEIPVFSNASNSRMEPKVPLVMPLVNPSHLGLIPSQRLSKGLRRGFIVTNPNCSTAGLVVPLKALDDAYGLKKVHVSTMQAVSGAGYPGISGLDIMGNVVPYIDGEEQKIQTETTKILGDISPDEEKILPHDITIDATCHRVPVVDGHLETVCVKFASESKPTIAMIEDTFANFTSVYQKDNALSCNKQPIFVMKQCDRPQPKLDLKKGAGYSVCVGRVRQGNNWDAIFTILSHNTILGAAGSSILNAEIANFKGYLH